MEANPFFPLDHGRLWVYSGPNGAKMLRKVVDEAFVKGEWHSVIEERNYSSSLKDSTVRRIGYRSVGNRILRIRLSAGIHDSTRYSSAPSTMPETSTWYDFGRLPGDQWFAYGNSMFFSHEIHEYQITLIAKDETLVVGDKTYSSCFKFFFDDLSESDSEYFEWIAEDVGLVKRVFVDENGPGFELVGRD